MYSLCLPYIFPKYFPYIFPCVFLNLFSQQKTSPYRKSIRLKINDGGGRHDNVKVCQALQRLDGQTRKLKHWTK